MKKFRLLVIVAFMIAAIGAFASNDQTNVATYDWVGWVKPENWYCTYYDLDWGWYCDHSGWGQVCTVQGQQAYQDHTSCENEYSWMILHRVY